MPKVLPVGYFDRSTSSFGRIHARVHERSAQLLPSLSTRLQLQPDADGRAGVSIGRPLRTSKPHLAVKLVAASASSAPKKCSSSAAVGAHANSAQWRGGGGHRAPAAAAGVPGGERRFLEALPGAPVWPARGVVSSACSDAGECVCGRRPSLSVIAGKGCDYGGVRPISQPEKGARGLPRS